MVERSITLSHELGDDSFLFQRLTGSEELGRLFRFDLDLLSERRDIDLVDLLGKGITVSLALEGDVRHFHGLIAHAAYLGSDGIYSRYQLQLVPWLWFLGRRRDCRIFQQLTVPDIVKSVFESWPIADFELKLDETYPVREYCVQYRESDLDFVCRLLEDEGIYFFHRHQAGAHKLILADGETAHELGPGCARIPYFEPDLPARRERDHIFTWLAQADVRAGTATLRDFDFERPRADLTGTNADARAHALATAEVYDYPGGYHDLEAGDRRARLLLETLQADQARVQGEGTTGGLGCGNRFLLERHPRKDQNCSYLVVAATYELQSEAYRSAAGSPGELFRIGFQALDLAVPFRPARLTPRPRVGGPQTATVTGPAGEEIYTDKYGRVKVQFHWDRLGKRDQDSSCWVRVSQLWAGSAFGGIHVPRIGQEVVVDFLEGDPDQPIITGRVYNALLMPPYALPANATQSGIKSNSSKGGGGSNELRFEDRKGAEEVWLHAQKDENIVVENDKTERVGRNETIGIGNDRTEMVGHDETLTVASNRSRTVGVHEIVTIGATQTISIGSAQTETVGGMRADTVALAEVRTVGGAQQQTVGAARNVSVGAVQAHEIGLNDTWTIGVDRSVHVGSNESLDVGGDRSADISGNDGLSVGKDGSITIGKNLTISAGDQITITTGSASILMKKDGSITISGKDITIDASGKINVKASGNITMKGQKILQN